MRKVQISVNIITYISVKNHKIAKKGYKNMLKLHLIEIFLRNIPEMLLMIWGIYVVVRKSINIKIYILSSIIMALVNFLVRMLPIYFGVHTLIIVILTICTMAIIDTPVVKAVYGTLLMFLILTLSEFLNVAILNLLNINTNIAFTNPIIKSLFGIPSLIIIYLFIITIRYFIKKKEGLKNVAN